MAHIYWEPQKGNLCRLHSLNVFYKNLDLGSKLTEKEFYYYCDLFDKYMDFDIKTIDNDTFSATQMNIISFILWQKSGLYTILIAPYQLKKELNKRSIKSIKELAKMNFYFEFNTGHIWGNYKDYVIDSLSGIHKLNTINESHGFIIPRNNNNLKQDLEWNQKILRKELLIGKFCLDTLYECILKYLEKDKIGENIQIPVATSYMYLITQIDCTKNKCIVLKKFNDFIKLFSKNPIQMYVKKKEFAVLVSALLKLRL